MSDETNELREMLTERGVEYKANDGYGVRITGWDCANGNKALFVDYPNGTTRLCIDEHGITPEQAVAVTLGNGTCKMHEERADIACRVSYWTCTVCGEPSMTIEAEPEYCSWCGRKVD